jgi:hypothetical protein
MWKELKHAISIGRSFSVSTKIAVSFQKVHFRHGQWAIETGSHSMHMLFVIGSI